MSEPIDIRSRRRTAGQPSPFAEQLANSPFINLIAGGVAAVARRVTAETDEKLAERDRRIADLERRIEALERAP